ncbi:TAP-like protein-domain-containing protein [Mycena sp. CBHHK59/15]|nr:TAP-like protein-domain-containing protein [Mycena sp. CBHHK59/15]
MVSPPISLKLIAASFFLSGLQSRFGLPPIVLNALATSDFEWSTLESTERLSWTDCYSGFQCTLLQVPLDYDASDKGNASIAIVRLPSNSSKEDYRGPILFNPGGPGGSGVDAVVSAGASIATLFGDEYDIVGFDPRGVSYSRPLISLFETDIERALSVPSTLNIVYPSLNESSNALPQLYARAQVLGQLAEMRDPNHCIPSPRRQTLLTWVDIGRRGPTQLPRVCRLGLAEVDRCQPTSTGFADGGTGYGSTLGATFATLFPDKVGRIIIDGVLDMEAYYSANMTNGMLDTDKTWQTFFDGCAAAGPDKCAFYAPTAAEIFDNFTALSLAIQQQPIPVVTPDVNGIVDYTFLRNTVFDALYSPYDQYPLLAKSLASLAQGNGTPMFTATALPLSASQCQNNASFHDNGFEAAVAVICGDSAAFNASLSDLQEIYTAGKKVSSFADLVTDWRIFCAGWKVRREGHFSGRCTILSPSIVSDLPAGPVGAVNTSTPLLIVGNTADPVTPLAGAIKTSKAFPGSVVLTQDSPGHTSTIAASLCTYGYFRQYFVNGTLPEAGTVCAVDVKLFASSSDSVNVKRDARDHELIEAVRNVGNVVRRVTSRHLRR